MKDIQFAPEWISVNDRIPNTSMTVLCYMPNHEVFTGYVHFKDNNWYFADSNINSRRIESENGWVVTHWAMLPKPPK